MPANFLRGPLRPQEFFKPTVNTVAPVAITPATAALILTTFAPTVSTPRVVIPGTRGLVLTAFAPTVATPRVVTPSTAVLTLTRYAPTVSTPRTVTPGTKALTLTRYAPLVLTPRTLTPATATLILTRYAPTVRITVPTTLRIRLNTREGTFVWPEDSYEAARRDQLPTRVEAETV